MIRPRLSVIFHYSGEGRPGAGGERGGVQVGKEGGKGHGPIGAYHCAVHDLTLGTGEGASTA